MKSLDSLGPDVLAALRAQAERDLARPIIFGAMACFAMVLILGWGTTYERDYPTSIVVFSTLTFCLGAGRLGAALRMRSEAGPTLFRWGRRLRRFTELQFAVWGAFAWWTLELYAFERASLLVLLSTAAFAGGLSSSLRPDLALARRALLLIVVPPIVWGAFQGTREGWVLVAFGAVYLAFLLLQVREHHAAYWATSVSAAQAGASERDRLFHAAFEITPVGIALIDCDGHFRRVNRRLCSMLGRTEDDLVGSAFQSLLENSERRQDWFEALKVGIAAREREEKFVRGSGAPLWATVSLAAVGGERPETLRYYVAMIQDVTERKQAEAERTEMEAQLRQAQKFESIVTLVAGIAHDVNNLLTVMKGYADLAAVELHGSPVAEDMGEIVKAAERARTLADQLLAFSRRLTTQPEILNLNQIVLETRELLQRTVGSHIQIDLSLDRTLHYVEVDAGQIQRVLLNLVWNSRDAMPEGGRISITTRMAELPASAATRRRSFVTSLVALTVSDTGHGMNAETKKRAFEPFFTTKEFGSGLGLAIVYGIVKQSGGEIRLESEIGRRTMVEILLPQVSAASTDPIAKEEVRDLAPREKSGAAVLVAEAKPVLRRLIETILESSGYEVSSAATAEEALEIFLENPKRFDVLLTDVVRPGGRNLADRVRQRRSSIGIVYMTVHSASEIAAHGVVEPNVAVLPKPFTTEDLRRAIKRVLGEEADGASA